MKKVLFTWFVLTLICVSFSVVNAEELTERKIYVTGKADIMVAPDVLILPIVVNSINDNLDIARRYDYELLIGFQLSAEDVAYNALR